MLQRLLIVSEEIISDGLIKEQTEQAGQKITSANDCIVALFLCLPAF